METIDFNTIHGMNNRWNNDSITWYEQASAYTGYHKLIMEYIGEMFKPEDSVCELACGAGALSQEIARIVAHVDANEINEDAIEHLQSIIKNKNLENISVLAGDWHEVCAGKKYDVVVYSYFGAMLQDWEQLKSIAKRLVIAILPSELKQKTNKRRETIEKVRDKLDSLGVYHTIVPVTIDFGQPFESRDAARHYLRHYYKFENEKELEEFIDLKLKPLTSISNKYNTDINLSQDGLYFPKVKDIGIVMVNMQKINK